MLLKAQNFLILLAVLSLVYVLRDNQTSPLGFLRYQAARALGDQKISQILCRGINRENDVSDSERNRADKYRSSVSQLRSGNPFIEFIQGPKTSKEFGGDYVGPAFTYGAPWFAFLALSLVTCLYFIVNWCCMYVCSCGPSFCKLPKSNRLRRPYLFASIVFMMTIFAAGIAGIVVSSGISKGGNETICTASIFMDKIIEGSREERWIGAQPATDKIIIVLDNINDVSQRLIPTLGQADPTVQSSYSAAISAVNSLYPTYSGRTVRRGDPTASPAVYRPTYIQNLNNETSKMSTEIDNKRSTVTESATLIDSSITLLKTGSFLLELIGELENAKERFVNVSKTISELQTNFTKSGGDAEDAFKGLGGTFIAVFVVLVVLSQLAVIYALFANRGRVCCNKLVHCSWCAIGLFMIVGWVFSSLLFPVTIVLFESCEVIDKFRTDPVFYNQTYDKFLLGSDETSDNSTTKKTLYNCFFQTDSLVDVFNLREKLFVFYNMAEGLDNTAPLSPSVQTVVDSREIPLQQQIVSDFKDGITVDAPEVTQDLTKLNGFTLSNQCSLMKDRWYINSGSCVPPDGYALQTTNEPAFNVRNPTCIGLNIWSSMSNADISQRYTPNDFPIASCGPTGADATSVQNFVNQFVRSRNDVNTLFGDIQDSLSSVSSLNGVYMTSIKNLMNSRFDPVRTTYSPIYMALSDQNEGVLPNLQCQFINKSIKDLEDKLCVRFGTSLYQTVIVFIIISFLSFFGMISLFCLAKRLLPRKKDEGTRQNNYEVEMHAKV